MYSIFPTQIGVYDIPFDKNLINEVMKDYKLKPINVLNGSKSSYLTETGTKFLEDNRLKDLTPVQVKKIIQDIIQSHLGWLVVWGGLLGAVIGFSLSLIQSL